MADKFDMKILKYLSMLHLKHASTWDSFILSALWTTFHFLHGLKMYNFRILIYNLVCKVFRKKKPIWNGADDRHIFIQIHHTLNNKSQFWGQHFNENICHFTHSTRSIFKTWAKFISKWIIYCDGGIWKCDTTHLAHM